MLGSHPEAKPEAWPLPGALERAQREASGPAKTCKTRSKPMFACQLPGRRASNSVLPPIDLTVRYGADIIRYRRDDQRLDRLPRGLGGRQRPRSKEAATVRRSVPGARRYGHARPTFSVDGAQIDTNIAAAHRSTLTGCSASANGRRRARTKKRSALAAAAWPHARRRRRHTNTTQQEAHAADAACDRAAPPQARVTTTKR